MNDSFVPYSEITPRQKEFLFFLVKWWADIRLLPRKEMKKVIPRSWFTDLEKDPSYNHKFILGCAQNGVIKGLLERGDAQLLFKQYPEFDDFEKFYCRRHSVQQAMLDLNVKMEKRSEYTWHFKGGYEQ